MSSLLFCALCLCLALSGNDAAVSEGRASDAKTSRTEVNNRIDTRIQTDEPNDVNDLLNLNAGAHEDKENSDHKRGDATTMNSKIFGAKKSNLRGSTSSTGTKRALLSEDEFYNLFDSSMDEWNADQWGFFASILTVAFVAFCCCCCFLLPMCCAGTSCLTDVLMTLLCVELFCDTTPSSGCLC
eukprot:CAMPEP_0116044718 /NCGR_PEP_ID=MMETSP0321-20121206/27182_1 /TAXON_ID=163516 /ORGANISM="Leptocylindrus danicus var. danicus, Strain B650" /LENGTH=183 /DNA_ID=CAMNT_0003525899 /DNA_START=9 /DNA_END=560 /DNA_ORIENTATION=-